jgi:hypothetical protein
MKTLHAAVLIVLLLAACAQQSTPTAAPPNLILSVRTEPEQLAVGETTLIVSLTDASGSPVDGAKLQIQGDMDHEGMMSVDREASESVNGEYRVPFEWTMGGGWIVNVTAQLPDGSAISQTFDFFVEAVSSQSIINRVSDTDQPAALIAYEPDIDPAIVGDAAVTITLTGEDNLPITDAVVEVTGNMAHQGMMPVQSSGEHTGDGRYIVPLRWSMAGDWQVTVNVALPDGSTLVEVFDQQVVMPQN